MQFFLAYIDINVLTICIYVPICTYKSVQVICFLLSFSPSENMSVSSKLVKFIGIKLHIMFFYPFNICRIYSDVTSFIPDIDKLCFPFFSFLWLKVSQFYLSTQRTSLWFSWFFVFVYSILLISTWIFILCFLWV